MVRALILAAVLAQVGVSAAHAQSNASSVHWQRYDVDITVRSDGSLSIAERQTIAFRGTFQHGFRVIPVNRTSGITDVLVAEEVGGRETPYLPGSNRPNTFTAQPGADGMSIDWWFAPTTNASRTFVLRYTAREAVRQYDSGDQVFWQAIYADRPGGIDAATISVHLPGDLAPETTRSAFYLVDARGGPAREAGEGRQVDARTVQFSATSLPSGTGLEARVEFPPELVQAPAPPWQADADRADWVRQSLAPIITFLSLLLGLAIVVGGGIGLLMLWYSRGREPAVGPVASRLTEPPSDLPAPLAGTLIDGSADFQDAVAAIVDLAERDVLSLEPEGADVRVALRRPTDDPSLRRYERVLLAALFGAGAHDGAILLSQARERFAEAVPVLADRLHEAVAREGLFTRDPEQTRRRYLALGGVVCAAGIVIAIAATALLGWAAQAVWLPGVAVALVGAGLLLLARAMPRRTPRGALEAARWKAFREHLRDDSRDGSVEPRYLAYAVAFGIDRDFLRKLERVGASAPSWYRAGGGPVIVVPGGTYGGPWVGPGRGGPWIAGPSGGGPWSGRSGEGREPQAGSAGSPPPANPQGWSDALADLLNSASDALARGGGSGGWSGGGWGGGGGGGGGRGGFN
ncbi:MAG: DUF2207 domain-containing protein [Chloroflexota bacterium]|nr:DUF2207 domain-containing protein [Chloroflexota bacterium]